MANRTILLVNGPNLNRLGVRKPDVYGSTTLEQIVERLRVYTAKYSLELLAYQSNHEGELIDFLQAHVAEAAGIIINPGALAHYGYALRDCLEDLAKPTVEVHISNVHARESFRHTLVLSAVVTGQIVGLGVRGYELAAEYLCQTVSREG